MSDTWFSCVIYDLTTFKPIEDNTQREGFDGNLTYDQIALLPTVPRVDETIRYSGRTWKVREVVYTHRDTTVQLYVVECVSHANTQARLSPYRG